MSDLPSETETFLRKVRQGLGTLSTEEQDEIVKELRSHLLDRQAQGKADLLAGFESPEDLSSNLMAESALRGTLKRGAFWPMARAVASGARESVLGLLLLTPLIVLQLTGLISIAVAVLKPFVSIDLGLWVGPRSFYIGRWNGNPAVHEVLGWWGIPILIVSGVLLLWICNRAMRALVRWRLRSTQR